MSKRKQVGGFGKSQDDDTASDTSISEDEEQEVPDEEADEIEETEDNEDNDDNRKNASASDVEDITELDNADDETKTEVSIDGERDSTCLYSVNKQSQKGLPDDFEDDNLEDDDLFGDDVVTVEKNVVSKDKRITKPILTKYERVRLLSERRAQLLAGAKPMIKFDKLMSEKDIASIELREKVIPMIIVRTLPNGNVEHWDVSELKIIN